MFLCTKLFISSLENLNKKRMHVFETDKARLRLTTAFLAPALSRNLVCICTIKPYNGYKSSSVRVIMQSELNKRGIQHEES